MLQVSVSWLLWMRFEGGFPVLTSQNPSFLINRRVAAGQIADRIGPGGLYGLGVILFFFFF